MHAQSLAQKAEDKEVLKKLQLLLSEVGRSPSRPSDLRPGLRCTATAQTLPLGGLTEVRGPLGSGKTEFVLRLLAENPEARVVWVAEEQDIYPCAFWDQGIARSRVLFAQAPKQMVWSALQVLRSGLFQILVLDCSNSFSFSEIELRRLQLSVEKTQTALILITDSSVTQSRSYISWPFSRQIEVGRERKARVLK